MLESISERMRQLLLNELYKKYDEINKKLQQDFVRTYYSDWEIGEMKEKLKRIDEIINEIKK